VKYFWYLFSQNGWHDGGNSTEQYGRALSSESCIFIHGNRSELVTSIGGLEIIPRSEKFVMPALDRPVDRQKIAMFCIPNQISLRYLEYCRAAGIKTVYRCVDDWRHNFGEGWFDSVIEEQMIALADLAVASSHRMADNYGIRYLPNACAYVRQKVQVPNMPPRVGFVGLADWPRFDLDLVRSLAEHFPEIRFEIVGTQNPWRTSKITALLNRPWNKAIVRMKKFDVGLVPYRGAYLEGMQPIKSWEYLGMGIPQLCQGDLDLPHHDSVYRYITLDDCVEKLRIILSTLANIERGPILTYAAQNSWQTRIRQLLDWLNLPT
jgi:hypothetical protein